MIISFKAIVFRKTLQFKGYLAKNSKILSQFVIETFFYLFLHKKEIA